MSRLIRASVLAAAVCVLAGCGGTGSSPTTTGSPASTSASTGVSAAQITARQFPPYGDVLTTSKGYAVYTFAPDDAEHVTCTGSCAATWPPVYVTGNAAGTAGAGLSKRLVGSDPDGGKQVMTYNGWPLYTYIADPAPGYASGEGLDINGGSWYLIAPSGQLVKSG